MTMPPSYHREGNSLFSHFVYKIQKSLYGLKQVSRQWFSKLSNFLLVEGFKHSNANHSLFVKVVSTHFIALLVYVDDTVIVSNGDEQVEKLKVLFRKA